MWAILAIVSSFFLGNYDIIKKVSLRNNAVMPVLFISSLTGSLLFMPFILLSRFSPSFSSSILFVPQVNLHVHFLLFIKAIIVISSWTFAYYAMKHLPVTIVSPIRSTAPLFTLLGAITIYGERLNLMQWIGVIVSFGFLYLFSFTGKKEGIIFRKDKWVLFMFMATLIGAISSLYDKFLIDRYDRIAVQAYYSCYNVIVLIPLLLIIWFPRRKTTTPFEWRWSIPFIGIVLTIADLAYFFALSYDTSLVSVVSLVRRSSVIVSFTLAAYLFKENNIKEKAIFLAGIIIGLVFLLIGS